MTVDLADESGDERTIALSPTFFVSMELADLGATTAGAEAKKRERNKSSK